MGICGYVIGNADGDAHGFVSHCLPGEGVECSLGTLLRQNPSRQAIWTTFSITVHSELNKPGLSPCDSLFRSAVVVRVITSTQGVVGTDKAQ